MPELLLIGAGTGRRITFSVGRSVREILETAGLRIRSACRGNGACGLCLVKVESGTIHPPTKTELLSLSLEQLETGTRLACQLLPETDLSVRIIATVAALKWRDLTIEETPYSPNGIQSNGSHYGLAVDLGTTHISLSLRDLTGGDRLLGRVGPNPQWTYGADVISRLTAASESADAANCLSNIVFDSIGEELSRMAERCGITTEEIDRVVFVGNTAMAVLLTGTEARKLLSPENWTQSIDYNLPDPGTAASRLRINPGATIEIAPPMAGFVGSDLLAGVLATGLTAKSGSLLIDFGTNSEIALWDGEILRVTSAAGGPAFETGDIRCGMPAEPGAVYRVERSVETGGWQLDAIGGGSPLGLCGTGLVDLLALLCDGREITDTGRVAAPAGESVVINENSHNLRLTKKDIDTFQRAKAAIGTGIDKLLDLADISTSGINRLCVSGAFGRNLDIGHAQRVGLLPDIPVDRIELCGNTALAGAERLLMFPEADTELESLRQAAVLINLAKETDFDTLFMKHLYLRPMSEKQE